MAEGVEIKELFIAESVADNDTMLIQQEGATKQINFETLRKKSAEKAISENNLVDEEQLTDAVAVVIDDLDAVKAKLPSTASADNQLADKDFVNSSIATNTAHYISNNGVEFNSVEELEAYSGAVTPNDYAFVKGTDEGGIAYYDRYKASVTLGVVTWSKEYRLNNSSFTAAQWAAVNSGITAEILQRLLGATETPVGAVSLYMGIVAPTGYIFCNDTDYSADDYPRLWALLPDDVKNLDERTFRIDMRDRVPQGANGNLGEYIEAGLPNIAGWLGVARTDDGKQQEGPFTDEGSFANHSAQSGSRSGFNGSKVGFDASRVNAIYGNSDTVQMDAFCFNYIIKY